MQIRVLLIILFLCRLNAAIAQPAEKILINTDKQWYYPGETIWLAVSTFNACGDTLAQISSVAYVELVGADDKPVIQFKLKIEKALGTGSLTVGDNIVSGNYNLVVYTSWMKNVGAASFARKPIYIVNPARPGAMNVSYSLLGGEVNSTGALRLETSKQQYSKREPVTVKISAANSSRVSVSVHRIDELEKGSEKIYMSQLSGPCTLVASGQHSFFHEKRGQMIVGKVIDKRTQLPAAGIRGYLSAIDYPDNFFVATSDSSGTILFDVGDISGKTELVLQTDAGTNNNYSIELLNPYADNASSLIQKGSDDVFSLTPQVIDEAMVSAQVQRIFTNKDSATRLQDSIYAYPFYGKPDAFYLMSDYVHFSTVEEIFREYIINVNVQKRGGVFYPIVIDVLRQKTFNELPLLLVNGVPVYDMDRFFKMNTDDFYSIAVLTRKYFMGHQVFYGIIDVRLKTPLKEFGANARVLDYEGTQLTTPFVSPDYSSQSKRNDRKPDFRNVLYWNPSVPTNNDGNGTFAFSTSDLEGSFAVVVQSISKDGRVNVSKSVIEVK